MHSDDLREIFEPVITRVIGLIEEQMTSTKLENNLPIRVSSGISNLRIISREMLR
jgi:hypothetical protein